MTPRSQLSAATTASIVVAVIAVSSSGPLIAFAAAPALAIAFWRNGLASVVLAPVAAVRRRDEFRRLLAPAGRPILLSAVLAGAFLALHFATWVPSVKMTLVANAVALGATQPVWQGLIALGQGRRLPGTVWLGIALAVGGAVLATGVDVGVSPRAVTGDLLALAGGVAGAAYTALGERARTGLSTTAHTTLCYGVCALALGGLCLVARVPLHGYPVTAWLAILVMTAGPQLLGHSMFNYALQRVSAVTISVLILLEVPGASLIGWVWLGQTPRLSQVPGLVLLVLGVAVVVLGAARAPSAPELSPADEL